MSFCNINDSVSGLCANSVYYYYYYCISGRVQDLGPTVEKNNTLESIKHFLTETRTSLPSYGIFCSIRCVKYPTPSALFKMWILLCIAGSSSYIIAGLWKCDLKVKFGIRIQQIRSPTLSPSASCSLFRWVFMSRILSHLCSLCFSV